MKTYQYKVSGEDITSRIPGLFPYSKFVDGNSAGIVPAFPSEDTVGCWGQYVADFARKYKFKKGKIVYGKFLKYTEFDESQLYEPIGDSGITLFSYRRASNVYYGIDEIEEEDKNYTKDWFERGIGKVHISKACGFDEDWINHHILAPEYIYLASISKLIEEYQRIHNILCCYQKGSDCSKNIPISENRDNFDFKGESDICCLWDRYMLMGGDEFLDCLISLEPKVESIAKEYYEYAIKPSRNNISVILTSSINDMGAYEMYVNRWMPGEKYIKGEFVTYTNPETGEDETYVCSGEPESKNSKFVRYSNGYYDEKTERLYFSNGAIAGDNRPAFKLVTEASLENESTLDHLSLPKDYNALKKGEDIKITGSTDSKLTSLRNIVNNSSSNKILPNIHEDWLSLYKVGLVTNLKVKNDAIGNIALLQDATSRVEKTGEYEMNLNAYGDVITKISYTIADANEEGGKNTITFEYIVGAHLKAPLKKVGYDDDGNKKYYYGEFEYDDTSIYDGVKYTETHTFDTGGDLYNLIKGLHDYGFSFDDLINKNKRIYTNNQFEFSKVDSLVTNKVVLNGELHTYDTIISNYTTLVKYEKQILYSPRLRRDYFFAMSYNPKLDVNVKIGRGNAAAYERHIKLSEVHTLEDLENYSNGGFFNVKDY